MMKESSIPNWLKSRTQEIKKSGKLDLSREWSFDPEALSLKQFSRFLPKITTLDLSGTAIPNLSNFPRFPSLKVFIADLSSIENFTNFSILKGITSISLKGTPVSHERNYRLSIAALLLPEIQKIDNKNLSKMTIERASGFNRYIPKLLNSGWNIPSVVPDTHEIIEECKKRGIFNEIEDYDSEFFSEYSQFNERKNVSKNDEELAKGISQIFSDVGVDVAPDDFEGILAAITELLPMCN